MLTVDRPDVLDDRVRTETGWSVDGTVRPARFLARIAAAVDEALASARPLTGD